MRSRDRPTGGAAGADADADKGLRSQEAPDRRRSRRWLVCSAASVAVLAVTAVAVADHFHLFDRGHSTPLSVGEIVHRYQTGTSVAPTTVGDGAAGPTIAAPGTGPSSTSSSTSSSPSSSPSSTTTTLDPLPAPGVYVYTTTGKDSVDALNGDHHDYPPTTTITVTAAGCGVLQRWDVVAERWSSWERCATGSGIAEPARDDFDSFFGQGQHDAYACAGESRPLAAIAGTTWTFTCTEGTATETHHGVVVGNEQRRIDTRDVDTLHVQVTIDDGDERNRQVTDSWFLAGTDLLIAQTGRRSTVNSSPIGDVHYLENYSITLTSTTPLT